ncbi:hypothetical protein NDU88_005186 [Pleurodeles waltl]|uniref:Uncharacterized protein n=1 Tax=Pleurodeles waltl TaxID=8319 RepID=A0AAV7PF77_PLEWA|nr:hypothetical protein NDU88_005186 [Pleurodeles waltl]
MSLVLVVSTAGAGSSWTPKSNLQRKLEEPSGMAKTTRGRTEEASLSLLHGGPAYVSLKPIPRSQMADFPKENCLISSLEPLFRKSKCVFIHKQNYYQLQLQLKPNIRKEAGGEVMHSREVIYQALKPAVLY